MNFFAKKPPASVTKQIVIVEDKVSEVVEAVKEKAKSLSLDVQLFEEFSNIDTTYLKELDEIINVPSKYTDEEVELASRLVRLGFTNTVGVREKALVLHNKNEAIKKKETAEYFRNKYPSYRFISKSKIDVLCRKYHLFLADLYRYKSDIPIKNQKEIVNFKVDIKDLSESIWSKYSSDEYKKLLETNSYLPLKDGKILAPIDKLDLERSEIKGYEILTKDPIVLQPVTRTPDWDIDGYLIVTAWGLEASDPEVVNPNHN